MTYANGNNYTRGPQDTYNYRRSLGLNQSLDPHIGFPPEQGGYLWHVIGGGPRFTENGTFRWQCGNGTQNRDCPSEGGTVVINDEYFGSSATNWWNRPQSAIGFSEDGNTIFFAASNGSVTMQQLHDVLWQLGARNNLKLDGGSARSLYYNDGPGQYLYLGAGITEPNAWVIVPDSTQPPSCNPNPDQVTLFVDSNFSGQCMIKNIGDYPNPGTIGLPNDSISSIKVGSNVRAILCRDDNYGGGCETFTGDDPNLGDNSLGDNQASSAKVENRGGGASGSWQAKYVQGDTCWWDTNCANFNNPNYSETIPGPTLNKDWGTNSPGGGMNPDNWVGDFRGTINFSPGDYVFQLDHDDGVKLWLNGQNIQDRGGSGSGPVCPARHLDGNTDLRVMLREQGGDAKVNLNWTTNTSVCQSPPVTNCPAGQYKAEYFNNRTLSGDPTFTRCENNINYDWGGSGPGNGLGTDNFSVRWTGRHNFSGGNYTFTARSDDGIRVWVDLHMLIYAWVDQGATEYRASRNLSEGEHEVKVEYYENGGDAVAQVRWEQAASCPTITEWKGEYFNNEDLSGTPALCRNDATINFDWFDGSPDPTVNLDHFSARWTRTLPFDAGNYQFRVFHDDGARLWVDNSLVIDQWGWGREWHTSNPISLSAGNHAIRLEMFEIDGWSAAQLAWDSVTGDQYEPDDTYAAARAITSNGSAQTHNFHIAGDNDWIKFTATVGTSYIIETLNLGLDSDTYLYLYNVDGVSGITHNDDSGGTLASRIDWMAPQNGTYYLRVRHYSPSAFGATTNYDVRVTASTTPTTDAYEPDETYAAARAITTNGSAQTHNFHAAGDNDWAKFTATAGTSYSIQTLNLGARSDTYLYLYDTNGTTEITHNDDSGGTLASRVDWTAPRSGTYYVRVRHYSPSTFGPTTNYDLRVMVGATPSTDAYEPDNTFGEARTIAVNGSAQTHNFHVAGDNDWVKFTATAGTSYVIQTLNLGLGSDTYLYLYDTNGTTEITHNDDSGGSLASRIDWTAPQNGTYYLRVRHYSASAYGSTTNYDLRVTAGTVPASSEALATNPVINSISPNSVSNNQDSTIIIQGSGFMSKTTVSLDYITLSSEYLSENSLSALVPKNFKVGTYKLIVRNPDGAIGTLPDGLTVSAFETESNKLYLPFIVK